MGLKAFLKHTESVLTHKAVLGVPLMLWSLLIVLVLVKMSVYGTTVSDVIEEIIDWSFAGVIISFMMTVTVGIPILHVALKKIREG